MADAPKGLHEAAPELSELTLDMHRALASLQEELEAVDWYRQRADGCSDTELRAVLEHNMREEIEHAAMVLEWLRRKDSHFDTHLRTYLWSQVPITEAEEAATGAGADDAAGTGDSGSETPDAGEATAEETLTLGSLKGARQSTNLS